MKYDGFRCCLYVQRNRVAYLSPFQKRVTISSNLFGLKKQKRVFSAPPSAYHDYRKIGRVIDVNYKQFFGFPENVDGRNRNIAGSIYSYGA